MRSTLVDVAREAGVSAATVDRVLNHRAGVSARTRAIVLDTARRLGYILDQSAGPQSLEANTSDQIQVDFVLPAGTNSFIKMLRRHIETQSMSRANISVRISAIEGFNPERLGRTLLDLRGQTQGVGVIALDHPAVREAIRSLSASGVKVVTIASDILHVPRVAYIGIDNRAAGRLAGYLLKRFVSPQHSGKVALFAGSLSYRGHQEREMGFRHILTEESPNLQIVELREMRDDREKAYAEASILLDKHADLTAIYNIGGGTFGIARALKERGLEHKVIFLGHEVTEDSKALLLDETLDAVIDQNPRVEAREALNILERATRDQPFEYHPPRLQVIFKENIPEL